MWVHSTLAKLPCFSVLLAFHVSIGLEFPVIVFEKNKTTERRLASSLGIDG
jgi:hypothetical protein